jgi:predicted transposase/invertase (TIGR01784 family)
MAATYILAGLKFEESEIAQIIRRDVMQESVTYQAILKEGRNEGREEGRQEIALNLLQEGISIDLISRTTGLSIQVIQQLQQQPKHSD